MMLPPIRKASNAPLSAHTTAAGTPSAPLKRHANAGGASSSSSEWSYRDELPHPVATGALASASSSVVIDRIESLERENELMRAELAHFRQHLSNNQHQREDERLSLSKVSDELQRLVHAFNNKVQADSVFQQREQQKCALLFAEVARLGHSVESVELAAKTTSDDVRRRLALQEQQLQFASAAKEQQLGTHASAQRSDETQHQVGELQHTVALMKSALTQLRSEVESDRTERWRIDNDRSQWLSELRSAVATLDASVDTKILHYIERTSSKAAADKMDVLRVVEEYRDATAGADWKRLSSQMLELSRVSDHVHALERWVHTEFAHIKRLVQFVVGDADARTQALALALVAGIEHCIALVQQHDTDHTTQLADLHDAVRDVAHSVQRSVRALEDVVPVEVRARQQSDDALHKRIRSATQSLARAIDTVRAECAQPQTQLRARVQLVEDAQRAITQQIDAKTGAVDATIRAFVQDADAMLARLGDAVERERQQTIAAAAVAMAPPLPAELELRRDATAAAEAHTAALAVRSRPSSARVADEPTAEPSNELTVRMAVQLDEQRSALESLQAWTVSHTRECSECYAYLSWAVERTAVDLSVAQCLSAVVDHVADAAAQGDSDALARAQRPRTRDSTAAQRVAQDHAGLWL